MTRNRRGKMKKLILLAIVLMISVTGAASGQSTKQKVAIEQEIRKLDLVHADAILRRIKSPWIKFGLKIQSQQSVQRDR